MKKNICLTLLISSLLLVTGFAAFAKTPSEQTISRHIAQQLDNRQQIAQFVQQLVQQDPAKVAELLLQQKVAYVSNETIVYIGVKGTDEVLVVCQINDFEVGTFYHIVHKKADRWIPEQDTETPPSTQGFATVFERKL